MTHRVVLVALFDGSRVLLGHRAPERRWYPNVWDFPGGHVEDGETPLTALAREAFEELGVEIEVDADAPLLHLVTSDLDLTVWPCRHWRGQVRNAQPEEHDELKWFTLSECEDLTLADDEYRPLLRRCLGEVDASGPR